MVFKAYENDTEEMAEEMSLFKIEVNDETSWMCLYQGLTLTLATCVERHF